MKLDKMTDKKKDFAKIFREKDLRKKRCRIFDFEWEWDEKDINSKIEYNQAEEEILKKTGKNGKKKGKKYN